MSKQHTPKEFILSAIAVIIAIGLILLLDWGLFYLLRHSVYDLLNSFNESNIGLKLMALLFGGAVLYTITKYTIVGFPTLFRGLTLNQLPDNLFTRLTFQALVSGSSIWGIVLLWKSVRSYNFWILCELLLLSLLIWILNAVIVPVTPDNKKKDKKD